MRSGVARRMSPSVDCLASLYCAEDVSGTAWNESEMCGAADRVFESQPAVFMDFPVEDDEAIATLLMKEAQFMPEADYLERYQSRKLSLEARLAAIEWILKVKYASFVRLVFSSRLVNVISV